MKFQYGRIPVCYRQAMFNYYHVSRHLNEGAKHNTFPMGKQWKIPLAKVMREVDLKQIQLNMALTYSFLSLNQKKNHYTPRAGHFGIYFQHQITGDFLSMDHSMCM
jgi:hypothetical protein